MGRERRSVDATGNGRGEPIGPGSRAGGCHRVLRVWDDGSEDELTGGHAYVDFPAANPYILACGGTTLAASNDKKSIVSETVLNDGTRSQGGAGWQIAGVASHLELLFPDTVPEFPAETPRIGCNEGTQIGCSDFVTKKGDFCSYSHFLHSNSSSSQLVPFLGQVLFCS
jgi:hypothetical protein